MGVVPSTTVLCGDNTFAVGIASTVDNVRQTEVAVKPPSMVDTTCHWISSDVNVPLGTVKLVDAPATLIVLIAPVAPARQRKVAEVWGNVACDIFHENTVGAYLGTYPDAGASPVICGARQSKSFHSDVLVMPLEDVILTLTDILPTGKVPAGTAHRVVLLAVILWTVAPPFAVHCRIADTGFTSVKE